MDRAVANPTEGASEPRWGVGDAVAGWLIAVSSASLIGTIILLAAGYGGEDGKPVEDIPMTLVAAQYPPFWLGFVGIPVWAAWIKGRGVVADFGLRLKAWDLWGVPIGAAAQLVLVPLVSFPVLWLSGTDTDELSRPARELADKAQEGATLGVILFALVVVVGAPFAEELFFRGLVLRAMEKTWGTTVALIGSSVVFGITHLQLLQFPALTAAGLVFGALAVRTGRLGAPILAHMAFNAVTVVNLLWFA